LKAKVIILHLFLILANVYSSDLLAQDQPKNNRQANKEVAKQRKSKAKEAKKADKEAMKFHYKSQGKKTKRRMKKNQKRTIKMKKNKKPPFWKSWFTAKMLELYIIERIA